MKKSLSDRIASRALEKKNQTLGAKNSATFLSLKKEIEEAIEDKWSIKQIWETLHEEGKVDFGYQPFRRNANKYILDNLKKQKAEEENKETVSTPEEKANSFKINHNPKREDLI